MPFNPIANMNQGLALGQNVRASQLNNQIGDLQQGIAQQSAQGGFNPNNSLAVQQLSALDPTAAAKILATYNALDDKRKGAGFQDARTARGMLESGNDEGFLNVAMSRVENIERLGGDPTGTLRILSEYNSGNRQGALDLLKMTEKDGIDRGFLSDPLDRKIKETRS